MLEHKQFFSGNAMATPKSQAGVTEALRMLSFARRNEVKAKTQTNQLRSLLISSPDNAQTTLDN